MRTFQLFSINPKNTSISFSQIFLSAKMLNSTFELITLATSNSHLIFIISNLIIIVLLINGSMKTGDDDDSNNTSSSKRETVVRKVSSINIQIKGEENKKKPMRGEKESSLSSELDELTVHTEKSLGENKHVYDDHSDNGYTATKIIDIDHEDEDELRRRAEEFIEKTNKRWKQEKLATLISN
ncbi:uncharacterized protein LOC113301261 [Papaver somniferum]|uniref:uncharacterized protein LOC113301261 n=1 Tax=Papaver somniferum TaxID=3469 RepID=UPI000E6F47A3|nr:uncharacterized protein LOC113301261 [Papaver somniferum]